MKAHLSMPFGHADDDTTRHHSPVKHQRGNFRFNTISALAILVFMGIGLLLQGLATPITDSETGAFLVAGVLSGAALLFILPYWPVVIAIIAALWAALPVVFEVNLQIAAVILSLGFLFAPSLEVISQWDKIVVLRLGRFHRVRGPGVLLLFPLLDSVAGYVDTRIRVTDFSAEKSLTRDTVPVHVDALAFWMVWNPEKAILEVENFGDAVSLSAQTALRASIGAHDLTTLLSERDRLGDEIQRIVDAKTSPWGITIISVEFKEILVPKELEDALSREAQAEREHSARVILGSTEAEIAKTFAKAADTYRDDPVALRLRAMNMIYESVRNKGGLVLVPSSALESMNLGTVMGTAAYGKQSGVTPDVPLDFPDTDPGDAAEPESTRDPGSESPPDAETGGPEGTRPSSSDAAEGGTT